MLGGRAGYRQNRSEGGQTSGNKRNPLSRIIYRALWFSGIQIVPTFVSKASGSPRVGTGDLEYLCQANRLWRRHHVFLAPHLSIIGTLGQSILLCLSWHPASPKGRMRTLVINKWKTTRLLAVRSDLGVASLESGGCSPRALYPLIHSWSQRL